MNVGKYKVIGRLGVGGMAEVFLATLGGIGGFQKTVVVKTILPNLLEEDRYVDMFLDEARVSANLSHPNIAQVYEIDEFDGRPFIAMEYIKGPTLGQIIRRAKKTGKQNIYAAAKIVSSICLGLDHAHNAKDATGNPLGIVHRDVSPHNIVVSLSGVPKLVDFGVAKSKDKLVSTRAGTMKGKLQYMPAEQIKGLEVDGRADVFASGICLYRATTWKLPFQGDSDAAKVTAVIDGRYERPSAIVNGYPPGLEKIIDFALQPDRDQRCPSAKTLHDAIEQWLELSGKPVSPTDIAAWVNELFPRFEEESHDKAVVAYALSGESSSPSTRRSGLITSEDAAGVAELGISLDVDGEEPSREVSSASVASAASQVGRSLGLLLIASLIAAGVGIGAVVLVLKNLDYFMDVPDGRVRATSTTEAPAVDLNDSARQFLAEATRLANEGKNSAALTLVEKGLTVGATDPAVIIDLSRLKSDIQASSVLAVASKAIETGDHARAMTALDGLLQDDPNNEAALALLGSARKAQLAAAEAAEAVKGGSNRGSSKASPRAKMGYLTVRSTPAATVFVDGVPVGRTPIQRERFKAGTHEVEVRATDFIKASRSVKISSRKPTKLSFTLEKAAKAPVAKVAAVTAKPPPPVKPEPTPKPPPVVAAPPPSPEPEPPPPAPVAKAAYRPRLPARVRVNDPDKLAKLFATIEREAIKGGAPALKAKGSTKRLKEELAAGMGARSGFGMGGNSGFQRKSRLPTASSSITVYPMAMFEFIVESAASGASASQTASRLEKAHSRGELSKRGLGK